MYVAEFERYTFGGYHSAAEKTIYKIDICERALKRLKYSYMKVLMQIAEL
jgi:hypothetical protein